MTERRWCERVGWGALGLVLVLLAVSGMGRGHQQTGDTQRLVTGSRLLSECLREGPRTRCAPVPGTETETLIGTFPPLQYVPTLAFQAVGLSDQSTVRALMWTNLACLALLAALLARWATRDRSPWPPLAGALVLSGPLLNYGTTGFGEMLAATVLVAFVLAVRGRRPLLIALTALLAATSKETMAPFLLGLTVLAGRDEDDGWLPPARTLVPVVLGLVGGTLASWALNVVRYDSIWNERYLEPIFQVQGVGRVAVNAVDVLVAPGGGLLPYWPAYVLLLVGATWAAVAATRRRELQPALARWAVLGLLAVFVVGLARWWAPFGWVAWGPRLLLPLLPALGLVVVWVGGDDLGRLVRRALLRPVGAALLVLAVVAGAYVAASGAWFVRPSLEALRANDAGCPGPAPAGTDAYWDCFDHRAWRLGLNPIRVAAGRHDAPATAARVLAVGGGVALVVAARERARRDLVAERLVDAAD